MSEDNKKPNAEMVYPDGTRTPCHVTFQLNIPNAMTVKGFRKSRDQIETTLAKMTYRKSFTKPVDPSLVEVEVKIEDSVDGQVWYGLDGGVPGPGSNPTILDKNEVVLPLLHDTWIRLVQASMVGALTRDQEKILIQSNTNVLKGVVTDLPTKVEIPRRKFGFGVTFKPVDENPGDSECQTKTPKTPKPR